MPEAWAASPIVTMAVIESDSAKAVSENGGPVAGGEAVWAYVAAVVGVKVGDEEGEVVGEVVGVAVGPTVGTAVDIAVGV